MKSWKEKNNNKEVQRSELIKCWSLLPSAGIEAAVQATN